MRLNHSKVAKLLLAFSLISISSQASSVDPDLLGFTLIAKSHVVDEFEGADFDKAVELDNGMVFKFNNYHYTYAYRPEASVYAKTFSVAELKKMGIKNPSQPIKLHKLLIKDHVYDVFKIR